MRRFYQQQYSTFKFNKIIKQTIKATLFEIEPNILIWIPKSWVIRKNDKNFVVKSHNSAYIKTAIQAEKIKTYELI